MHTVFALLCFAVVIHWLIFPYPSGLLHWHCGNLTIAPVPAKQPWWIWINTSCEFIMNDCITPTKQSTTNPCAYFLGYTVHVIQWGSTTHPCPHFNGGVAETSLNLQYGWVITFHGKLHIWIRIHVLFNLIYIRPLVWLLSTTSAVLALDRSFRCQSKFYYNFYSYGESINHPHAHVRNQISY